MDSKSHLNINPITKLSSFINDYPDQSLHEYFKILQQQFPTHRAVKGDGNCFYRCFAFLYLALSSCDNYTSTFPSTTWNYKKKNSLVHTDAQFQQKLQQLWNRYIKQLSGMKNRAQKQYKLQNFFNQIPAFDQLMIGYFRSINYQQTKKNRSKLLPFASGDSDFHMQLERIAKFGAQSQGIQIYNLAKVMNVHITIFCIDHNGFQPISYMQNVGERGLKDFYLFFRPGHYDIVYQKMGHHFQNKQTTSLTKIASYQSTHFLPQMSSIKSQKSIGNTSTYRSDNRPLINSQPAITKKSEIRKVQIKQNSTPSTSINNNGKFDLNHKTIDRYPKKKQNNNSPSKLPSRKIQRGKTIYVNEEPSFQQFIKQMFIVVLILAFILFVKYYYFS